MPVSLPSLQSGKAALAKSTRGVTRLCFSFIICEKTHPYTRPDLENKDIQHGLAVIHDIGLPATGYNNKVRIIKLTGALPT